MQIVPNLASRWHHLHSYKFAPGKAGSDTNNLSIQENLFRFSPSEARTLDRGPPPTETDGYKNIEFDKVEHYAMKNITFSSQGLDRGQTPLAKSETKLFLLSKHLSTIQVKRGLHERLHKLYHLGLIRLANFFTTNVFSSSAKTSLWKDIEENWVVDFSSRS